MSNFTAIAKIQNGRVVSADHSAPYALITLDSSTLPQEMTFGVVHKLDFKNLWKVFVERGVAPEEEVILCWRKGTLRGLSKLFSKFMPGLAVMICRAGAYSLLTDRNHQPELRGEARFRAEMPILDLTPEVLR